MDSYWLDFMTLGGEDVNELLEKHGTNFPARYQFKWDIAVSIAIRGIAGRLRHLPSGDSALVRIKFPG